MQRYTVYFIWKFFYIFRVVPQPIIRWANNCIYSIWYLSHCYCYLPLSRNSWNRSECAVGGVRHPQHTQTGSNYFLRNWAIRFKYNNYKSMELILKYLQRPPYTYYHLYHTKAYGGNGGVLTKYPGKSRKPKTTYKEGLFVTLLLLPAAIAE
jgi:hypothetical protein